MIPGSQNGSEVEQARTTRLLFDAELVSGVVDERALGEPRVRGATRVSGLPARPLRIAQQVAYKLRRLDHERNVNVPLAGARRLVLGERASASPRFLVRVDEYPHYRAWDDPTRFGTDSFERFHEILAAAGVPYLLAVLPRVSREPLVPSDLGHRPLDRAESALLERLASERVTLALHGLTHRTRFASPRRHSELCGLSPVATGELLDTGLAELATHGVSAKVFVPPYNRFDATQFEQLSERFEIVCGGPESIGHVGFQRSPQWWGETVYLPSYAPFYGHSGDVLPAVRRAIEQRNGLWTSVVLHWGWEERDGWGELERLVSEIARFTAPWDEFLGAVRRSRVAGHQ